MTFFKKQNRLIFESTTHRLPMPNRIETISLNYVVPKEYADLMYDDGKNIFKINFDQSQNDILIGFSKVGSSILRERYSGCSVNNFDQFKTAFDDIARKIGAFYLQYTRDINTPVEPTLKWDKIPGYKGLFD